MGKPSMPVRFGAAGGTLGTGAGAVIALVFFLFLLFAYRPAMKRQRRKDKSKREDSYGRIVAVLTITILPIVLSSTIYNISSVLDNYLFASGLRALGQEDQMAELWGVFGEYHLLFNIPVALASALSSSLIPTLANAAAMRDRKVVLQRTRTAIRFSMIIAIPAAVGLAVLAEPICNLLFAGHDNALLIKLMVAGSAAVVFFSLSTMTNAILQGTNHMGVSSDSFSRCPDTPYCIAPPFSERNGTWHIQCRVLQCVVCLCGLCAE